MVPGNAVGSWGMTVNTSQLNFGSEAGSGMFGYSGSPGQGNLYFSLSPNSGTDNFGNTFGAGLNVNSGTLQTVSIIGSVMDPTTVLNGSVYNNGSILQPVVTGGTAISLVHTFTNNNGQVLGYTAGTTTVSFTVSGLYQWTCPAGVTQARIQCWGAGAGGGGGSITQGGEGGGAGEYAEEPAFALTPGAVYNVYVGNGGAGGETGNAGGDGTLTAFVPSSPGSPGVNANGGSAGSNFQGGNGGTTSVNTIHFNGGNGASGSGLTGGSGGGSSAGPASQGSLGVQSSGAAGGAGGAAVPGGGAGGNGGSNDTAGLNGVSPGGAGGGAGAGITVSGRKVYQPDRGTYSYYGADASPPFKANALRNHDGYLYQGVQGVFGLLPLTTGLQFSYITLPYATIQADLAGVTVTSVEIHIKPLYGVYGNTLYCVLGYSNAASFGNSAPSDTRVSVRTFPTTVGRPQIVKFPASAGGIGVALQNGNAKALILGPGSGVKNPYWGYFDSGANFGYIPSLFVYYYTGTPTVNAGNGADGQVSITYQLATPVLQLAVSQAAATDAYGYSFQPGFTGQQLNLTAQASPPAATAATAIISASAVGTPQMSLPSGMFGLMPSVQTDSTPFTVTSASTANVTKAWTIPSGDAQVNTLYRLKCYGLGTQGNIQETLLPQLKFGSATVQISAAAATIAAAANFSWEAECEVRVITGGAGAIDSKIAFSWQQNAGASTTTTLHAVQVAHSQAMTTTTSNVYALQMAWGGVGNTAPTITCYGSSLERLGP